MAKGREGWVDQSGLNLIRVIIGAYYLALANGLVDGQEFGLVFSLILPPGLAHTVAASLLSGLALIFMFGIFLRASALALAGFLLVGLLLSLPLAPKPLDLGQIWQDVALIGAVMLCYGSLKRHEMHKAALFSVMPWRGGKTRVLHGDVKPRRVHLATGKSGRHARTRQDMPPMRPLIAPIGTMPEPSKPRVLAEDIQGTLGDEDGELKNIFLNL